MNNPITDLRVSGRTIKLTKRQVRCFGDAVALASQLSKAGLLIDDATLSTHSAGIADHVRYVLRSDSIEHEAKSLAQRYVTTESLDMEPAGV